MNLKQLTKKERARMPKRISTKTRIKVGRVIHAIAAAPIGTSWLFAISVPMTMKINPSSWAKGRLNERRGNGDLRL